MSAAAAIRTAQADQLGDQIIAAGFAPNGFVLDINEALDVPRDFPLSAPWNLPSRLFQFPIEVIRAEQDEPRKIGLRHPLRSEEHTSELQSLMRISYAVFCLKKKTPTQYNSDVPHQ